MDSNPPQNTLTITTPVEGQKVQLYLANERTMLAYFRTSLAAGAVGVTIARIIPLLTARVYVRQRESNCFRTTGCPTANWVNVSSVHKVTITI